MLLLVTKEGDKLFLKFHAPPVTVTDSKKTSTDKPWAPVLSLDGLSVREKASDKMAFFLFTATSAGAQMYELAASSAKEQKEWIK